MPAFDPAARGPDLNAIGPDVTWTQPLDDATIGTQCGAKHLRIDQSGFPATVHARFNRR